MKRKVWVDLGKGEWFDAHAVMVVGAATLTVPAVEIWVKGLRKPLCVLGTVREVMNKLQYALELAAEE